MKGVKEAMKKKGASDDEIKEFEKGAQSFAKKILGNFKDYEFLIGESMDPDGMCVVIPLLSNYLIIYFSIGLSSLTTAKMALLLTSQCGSMV